MGILRRLGLFRDRRASARAPVTVDARLELDALDLSGVARDLGEGGIFFETDTPLSPGLRATLVRGDTPATVRVTWQREAHGAQAAGVGLAYDPGYILIRKRAG
jgi:hypothetical protein